jgi:hypothetical protein
MIQIVRVIDEEIVDQDRHLHQYLHHLHLQQHHLHDQMILFDEQLQQIHVIAVQDENMTVNNDDDIIIMIITIVDDPDPGQEDSEFKLYFFKKSFEIILNLFPIYFLSYKSSKYFVHV